MHTYPLSTQTLLFIFLQKKNSDNTTSTSSSGLFNFIVSEFSDWNESMNHTKQEDELIEEAITSVVVPLVTSTFEGEYKYLDNMNKPTQACITITLVIIQYMAKQCFDKGFA